MQSCLVRSGEEAFKAELLQLNRAQFSSLIFVSKKVGNRKN
jgi:hypothetical protein